MSYVQDIHAYIPGKSIAALASQFGLLESDIIKLASNENPLGASEQVTRSLIENIQEIARYPDGNNDQLKTIIAKHCRVDPNQCVLGNGSNDVLDLIARAYLGQGMQAIYSQYAFAVYGIAAQSVGADSIVIPAINYGHDLFSMAAAITEKTRVIFIANPNNPTGTWFDHSYFLTFLAQVPTSVLIVLDEAYIEYSEDTQGSVNSLNLLADHPNLIVVRTLSKAYGLAGLRIGYGVCSASVAGILNKVRQPFNVNTLAVIAASVALNDDLHLIKTRKLNKLGKLQLESGLSQLSLSWIPSMGNFLTVRLGDKAGDIFQKLLQLGIIVRPLTGYDMPEHLRISIGLPEENKRLLEALTKILDR
ncbi:UNVERIFIED_CONTAM: hypothetical protein GTU68_008989 [Idotea baltica]|nr:hypothetical protein [Idotea baltica]